jgi:hypothetical protein
MYCGKSTIPIGAKVKIVKNLGNECEPFLNCTGVTTHPYYFGCCKADWVGVYLDQETIYGKKFNFHTEEIEIISDEIQ